MLTNVYQSLLAVFNGVQIFNTVSIYNNQVERIIRGQEWKYNFPACFIEIEEKNATEIGELMTVSDLDINFHIVMREEDSSVGTLDQNLNIFQLRNVVKRIFSLFKLTTGGFFQWAGEDQDYKHTNVYHYVLTYRAHQIDLAAQRQYFPYEVTPIIYTIWNECDILWNKQYRTWDQIFTGGDLMIFVIPEDDTIE